MCIAILYNFYPETILFLRKIQWDIVNADTSLCKVPIILVTF